MMVARTAILNERQLSGEKGPGSPLLKQLSSRSERQLRACEIPHVSIRKNWITLVETERHPYGGRRLKALYMLHLRCLLENNVYISRYSCKYNSIRTSCIYFLWIFFLARTNKLLYGAGEFCIDSFCVVFKILAWYHLLPSSVKILSISFPLNEERSMNMTVASLAKPMGQSSWGCGDVFLDIILASVSAVWSEYFLWGVSWEGHFQDWRATPQSPWTSLTTTSRWRERFTQQARNSILPTIWSAC